MHGLPGAPACRATARRVMVKIHHRDRRYCPAGTIDARTLSLTGGRGQEASQPVAEARARATQQHEPPGSNSGNRAQACRGFAGPGVAGSSFADLPASPAQAPASTRE